MAERVDDVALEAVGRAEQLVDHEIAREGRVDAVEVNRVEPVGRGDRQRADALDTVVDEELGIGQTGDVAPHQARELGVDFPDAGDEPQPDFVAQVFGRAVRRIFAEGDVFRHGEFENLLARGEHERAYDAPHLGRDARQAAQPRAAQQVDEEGLNRVVGVVCHGDGRIVVLAAQFVEPGVAQTAGGHLHRFARTLHLGGRVEAAVVAGHAVAGGLVGHEHLVFVALGAAQLEVAVGDPHLVAAADEEREHDHRVDAARDGEQDASARGEQLVFGDVALEGVQKMCHRQNVGMMGRPQRPSLFGSDGGRDPAVHGDAARGRAGVRPFVRGCSPRCRWPRRTFRGPWPAPCGRRPAPRCPWRRPG